MPVHSHTTALSNAPADALTAEVTFPQVVVAVVVVVAAGGGGRGGGEVGRWAGGSVNWVGGGEGGGCDGWGWWVSGRVVWVGLVGWVGVGRVGCGPMLVLFRPHSGWI